jgi:NitT/TauT family transport system substrate-binding protein
MSLRRLGALLSTLIVALLGGCGGDSGDGGGAEQVTLKVGVLPIADVAPLYLGAEKGFFERENLVIEPQVAAGGAAVIPAVVSGDFQIGFSNVVSPIIAVSKDLPLRVIASGSQAGKDDSKVLVAQDSPVREKRDLEGRSIAVNTLNNIGTVTINAALERAGVDSSKIKYVEIDFPDMEAALDAGQVDAIWLKEPFITNAERGGAREILNPYTAIAPRLNIGVWFAAQPYIDENREVVDRFVRALKRSMRYAQSHPQEVRKTITEFTETPPEAAKVMDLPNWSPQVNEEHVDLLTDLTAQSDLIKEQPETEELILE